jgi:hypothetical protein
MSHIPTAELAVLTGYTKRQIQRMAAKIPGAVRTDGGHWKIPDSPEVRKWCASQAKRRQAEKLRREDDEARKYFSEVSRCASTHNPEGAERMSIEIRMGRQMRNLMKTIEELEQWDGCLKTDLPNRANRLGKLLILYSESWQRADGAV